MCSSDLERMAQRMAKGQFDLNDLRGQLAQMRRMGGLGALAGMIPGMKKAQAAMAQTKKLAVTWCRSWFGRLKPSAAMMIAPIAIPAVPSQRIVSCVEVRSTVVLPLGSPHAGKRPASDTNFAGSPAAA